MPDFKIYAEPQHRRWHQEVVVMLARNARSFKKLSIRNLGPYPTSGPNTGTVFRWRFQVGPFAVCRWAGMVEQRYLRLRDAARRLLEATVKDGAFPAEKVFEGSQLDEARRAVEHLTALVELGLGR